MTVPSRSGTSSVLTRGNWWSRGGAIHTSILHIIFTRFQPLLHLSLELVLVLWNCFSGSAVRGNAGKVSLSFRFRHKTSHGRRHLGEVAFVCIGVKG